MKNWKMNPYTYQSGYVPLMIPNPTTRQLPPRPPQNGSETQNVEGFRKQWRMEDDTKLARCFVLEKVIEYLQHQPYVDNQRMLDLARNIEALLLRGACSKEEYADRSTLVPRIQFLLKRSSTLPSCQQPTPCIASGSEPKRFQQIAEPISSNMVSDMQPQRSIDGFPSGTPNYDFDIMGINPNLGNSYSGFNPFENFSKPQLPDFIQQQQLLLMQSYFSNSANVSCPSNFNSITIDPPSTSTSELPSIPPQASGNSSFESQQAYLLREVMNYLKHGNMNLIAQGQYDFLHCSEAKKYWIYVSGCHEVACGIPNCKAARSVWKYHQMCRNLYCTFCSSSGPKIMLHEATDLYMQTAGEGSSSCVGSKRVRVVPDVEILGDTQYPLKRMKMDHASTSYVSQESEIPAPDFSFTTDFVANNDAERWLPFNLNDPIIDFDLNSFQENLDEKREDSIDHAVVGDQWCVPAKNVPDQSNTMVIHEKVVPDNSVAGDHGHGLVKYEPVQDITKVNPKTEVLEHVAVEDQRHIRVKVEPDQDTTKVNREIRLLLPSNFHHKKKREKKNASHSRKPLRSKVSYRILPESPSRKFKISDEAQCSKRMKRYHPSNSDCLQAKEKLPVNPKNLMINIGPSQGPVYKAGEGTKDSNALALIEPMADQDKAELQESQVPVEVPKVAAAPHVEMDHPPTTPELPKLETALSENPESSLISTESCVSSAQGIHGEKKKCRSPAANSCEFEVKKKEVMTMVKKEPVVPMVVADPELDINLAKPKIKGVSLTEMFTTEQIREHIANLRQRAGQRKLKIENIAEREYPVNENSCQLCHADQIYFEPLPIYCSSCGTRIKRKSAYHAAISGESSHYFCVPCVNDGRFESIKVDGLPVSKSRLEKKRNDDEVEEEWVQCDKCEAWQHQICALFNGKRNDMGQAEYTCPYCYLGELERGERKPLPQSAVLGAIDLPATKLSDHLEQRLFKKLKQERQERARVLGKNFDEVPGAESLVIRVVSSLEKKLEVKKRFLDIFKEENYPSEFPYKSKAILLFQRIEGVDVCLFGVYVQEFGSGCPPPNNRRVYLSYLDSVKYFRPEIRTVSGEALRTFVYHEILIGYLEYCKERGFTSCYIWACPPLKGDDYILYCHPKDQKTPKSDKLREWYSTMLEKAVNEDIILELTNLYDQFFLCTNERKTKITAACLPYFDGDYWPGYVENIISQFHDDDGDQQRKGKTVKAAEKRATEAGDQDETSCDYPNDALLMQKIGETILPIKNDFIMVHMQHACSHCCEFILSGRLWTCNSCRNFHLCEKCHEAEEQLDEIEKHPIKSRKKHDFYSVEMEDINSRVEDRGDLFESEFFDTRQTFLSLCQGNHYQFDSLRRAKHSSMMILYHLHNPNAPAFISTCNVCHHDIGAGKGWRCETCPDYDICNTCYENDEIKHDHKLRAHPSSADHETQNKVALQRRVNLIREMLDLLVHASKCSIPTKCQYRYCMKVKHLFSHRSRCTVLISGGCVTCKKIWSLIRMHAQVCKEPDCDFPRCSDVKKHLGKLRKEAELQRRVVVMEKVRSRAAEMDNGSG